MKARLTAKGARRLGHPNWVNKIVDVTELKTMPWGARMATVTISGMSVKHLQVYTPKHGKDYALELLP
jgi:hypothetical protein